MRSPLYLLAALVFMFSVSLSRGQEDYPIPPADPDTWQIPGRTLRFIPQGDWPDIPPTAGDPNAYWQSQTQQALKGIPPEDFFFEEAWRGLCGYPY